VPTLTCHRCDFVGQPILYWHTFGEDARHLGALCARCKRWLRWVPQIDEWMEEVTIFGSEQEALGRGASW